MKRYYALFSPEWDEYVKLHDKIGFETNGELLPDYLFEYREDAEQAKDHLLQNVPWKFSTLEIVEFD